MLLLCIFFFFVLSPSLSSSFLFPSSSGGSCGCSCTPPPSSCPVSTPCPPIMTCQPPPSPPVSNCCNSCNSCKTRRRRRHVADVLSNATFVADSESIKRVKREDEGDLDPLSTKCNSEELRRIIETKIDRVTAIAKRRIQEEAESTLGGRFNVICARGDFSYVANTELFCQHSVGDVTCFLFKQLSDVVRRRLM